MEFNGWIYYDRILLVSDDWLRMLEALHSGSLAARAASNTWPGRAIDESVRLIRTGDQHEVAANLTEAIEKAGSDVHAVAVRWDLSQGGTSDPREPEYSKIRSFQLVAKRGSGLTLYASSPDELDVGEFLAIAKQPAERVLNERPG